MESVAVKISHADVFGYLLDTDEGYISHWEFPDPEREDYESRQYFMVDTMSCCRHWFTPEQVEEGYRGLCRERKSKNEEARKICRRVRQQIRRISYLPNLDNKIVQDLRNTIHLLDEMYEKI
jgi:hypothetical protein